jgi:hypothetical protein
MNGIVKRFDYDEVELRVEFNCTAKSAWVYSSPQVAAT